MEVATKLALFVGGLVVAVVAGWALGRLTASLNPDLIVPGYDPVHVHALAPASAPPVVVL